MDRLLEYVNRHPFLVSLAVALLLAIIAFELRARRMGFAALPPQDAIRLMNQGAAVYDLRAAEAFAAGHISNAKHLAADQLDKAADVLKKYREKFLVIYCEDGNASASLARRLHAAGFTKTFNLRGGLATWRADGLPLVR
ncbi:MAG: rhodanese-like domain-containing protein [Proteobacteria bacterium]|jgi:rhodanese-related sulfurtransferase|nr:rhodanese-like domain-containing protein [Pseudomonadota bacterium]MBK7115312.1 rhodanese-like domain-containing protein [Pseudomonadota bacterium]MBK9253673.1 rhodanese-like domain-containing protein [Pseudomonadota bacterium]MCC6630448.1 rhodanese-like domain-containing protein [Gammaproteobacteria bacterium]